jgi:hypothetical protein
MDAVLAALICAYINQNIEKKKNIDLLEFEIISITTQLLKKNERIDNFFDFFLYAIQRKCYSVQIIGCQILKRYF